MMSSTTQSLYVPYRLYPDLFVDHFKEDWVHNDWKQMIHALDEHEASLQQKSDPQQPQQEVQLDDWIAVASPYLRVETSGVYSFNAFNETFIQMFNDEIQNFYEKAAQHDIPIRRPNSMNNYGVIVNEIGMRPMISALQQHYIWPVARRFFPKEGQVFHDHHSFIVRYQAGEDLGLDMHTDDSDVTFNACVGHNFTGATLRFCGVIGAPDHRQHSHTYAHQVGRAVVHRGTRRHGADDIATGTRANLIVWNHNHEWRSSAGYRAYQRAYDKERAEPDPTCLSYTHDRDYQAYKEIPESKRGQRFHPWCPPHGKEYDTFHKRMLERGWPSSSSPANGDDL